jgi:hypothetical protein
MTSVSSGPAWPKCRSSGAKKIKLALPARRQSRAAEDHDFDSARVARPSDTLAQSANPPAREFSAAPSGRPRTISTLVPSIAARPNAVTSRRPLMRRCAPGSMRWSQRATTAGNDTDDPGAEAGSVLEFGATIHFTPVPRQKHPPLRRLPGSEKSSR